MPHSHVPFLDSVLVRSPKAKPIQIVERALLAAGVVLLAIAAGATIQGAVLSRFAVRMFETSATPASPKVDRNPVSSPIDFSLWPEKRTETYSRSLAGQFPRPLAVLRAKSIRLEVPVLDGTDSLTLNRGAGWIRGTTRPDERGNIGIAGHRDGFFRRLKDLKVGDTMDLVTRNRTDTFVVDNMQIVNPGDVDVLQPGSPSLTLVTCYPFYFVGSAPKRYIVHASMAHSELVSTDSKSIGNVSKQEEP